MLILAKIIVLCPESFLKLHRNNGLVGIVHKIEKLLSHTKADFRRCEQIIRLQSGRILIGQIASYSV
jgi:hypothetical protein